MGPPWCSAHAPESVPELKPCVVAVFLACCGAPRPNRISSPQTLQGAWSIQGIALRLELPDSGSAFPIEKEHGDES